MELNAFYATKKILIPLISTWWEGFKNRHGSSHTLVSFVQDDEDFDRVPIDGFEAEVVLTKYQCVKFVWIDEKQADGPEALKDDGRKKFYFTVIFRLITVMLCRLEDLWCLQLPTLNLLRNRKIM